MDQKERRAALARMSCIVAFIVSVVLIIVVAAYIELQRSSNSNLTFVGDGGLFTEAIWLPILFLIGSIAIPFAGLWAGLDALNHSKVDTQDKLFLGTLAGNLTIFLPVFLTLSYFFVLFLNQI